MTGTAPLKPMEQSLGVSDCRTQTHPLKTASGDLLDAIEEREQVLISGPVISFRDAHGQEVPAEQVLERQ